MCVTYVIQFLLQHGFRQGRFDSRILRHELLISCGRNKRNPAPTPGLTGGRGERKGHLTGERGATAARWLIGVVEAHGFFTV